LRRAEREPVVRVIANLQRREPRERRCAAQREVGLGQVQQPVAAALRFEQQRQR